MSLTWPIPAPDLVDLVTCEPVDTGQGWFRLLDDGVGTRFRLVGDNSSGRWYRPVIDARQGEVFGEVEGGVLPASLWWVSWPGTTGWAPCRSRAHTAMRSG
jgi:hypothetical protein